MVCYINWHIVHACSKHPNCSCQLYLWPIVEASLRGDARSVVKETDNPCIPSYENGGSDAFLLIFKKILER